MTIRTTFSPTGDNMRTCRCAAASRPSLHVAFCHSKKNGSSASSASSVTKETVGLAAMRYDRPHSSAIVRKARIWGQTRLARGMQEQDGSAAPAGRGDAGTADRGAARWRCRQAGGRRRGHHHQRIEARPGGDAGELVAGATVTTTSGSRRGQVATPASWWPAPRSPPPADRG